MVAINAFGDSITAGAYMTAPQMYINQVAARFGVVVSNYAVSGDMAMDQAYKIEAVSTTDICTIMVGTNDSYWYAGSTAKITCYKQYLRALAVVMGGAVYASGRNITTKTGVWNNLTTAGNSLGCYTDQVGATATNVIHGTAAYIGVIMFGAPSSDPTFEVWIDGTHVDTVTLNGATAGNSLNNCPYSDACLRYGGLSNGSHTVMVKQAGSVRFHLSYIAGSEMITRKPMVIGNTPKKNSYTTGDNDANVANFCAAVASVVSELQTDGFNVQLADVHSVIDPLVDLEPDGIHPNVGGHVKIANVFITALLATLTPPTVMGGGTTFPTGTVTKTLNFTYTCDGAGGITGPYTVS